MPNARSAGRISIRPLDDLFEPTITPPAPSQQEALPTTLPPNKLQPFPNHPFKVVQDEAMQELVESVRQNGVIEPILCRPDRIGGYQIISGHRRQMAAMLAGLQEVPVTIRDLPDHAATIIMVDSNLHRPTILPSEKAFAFKMKLDALEEQRRLGLLVSIGRRATEIVGEETGDNYRNVMRYLRLTELSPELLTLVDSGKIKFHPAIELSYLKPAEQEALRSAIEQTRNYPSISQAKTLKQLSRDGALDADKVLHFLHNKKTQPMKITFSAAELREFFPNDYSAEEIKDTILDMLEARQRSRAGRER